MHDIIKATELHFETWACYVKSKSSFSRRPWSLFSVSECLQWSLNSAFQMQLMLISKQNLKENGLNLVSKARLPWCDSGSQDLICCCCSGLWMFKFDLMLKKWLGVGTEWRKCVFIPAGRKNSFSCFTSEVNIWSADGNSQILTGG